MSTHELKIGPRATAITRHPSAYYAGFLSALEQASRHNGQVFVTLSPEHVITIKQLLFDYGLLEDRRITNAEFPVYSRRANDKSPAHDYFENII